MSKFTNVDYNKDLYFPDQNPFATTLERKLKENKNWAIDAYKKKVSSYVSESMYNARKSMKGPEYGELILNKGTDAEMLNPDFYNLMKIDPESILESARAGAKDYGLNPASIKPEMIMTDELSNMKNAAVRQHYDELARYQDEFGDRALQKLLDKEGPKFTSFYRKYTDPYINEGRALYLPPGADRQLRLARRHGMEVPVAAGQRFKEVKGQLMSASPKHATVGYIPGRGWGYHDMEVLKDDEGRFYTEGFNPLTALLSNLFGSGNVDVTRNYYADEDNPDDWFWWGK